MQEPAQTHCSAQFEGSRFLLFRNGESLTEIRLRLVHLDVIWSAALILTGCLGLLN